MRETYRGKFFCDTKGRVAAIAAALYATGAASVTRVAALTGDTIFDGLDNGSGSIIERICTTYNKSIMPISFVILVICAAISGTNQKFADLVKTGFKILIIASVALNCINLFAHTITWIAEKLGGSTSVAVIDSLVRMV